jgi:hypothetical protein
LEEGTDLLGGKGGLGGWGEGGWFGENGGLHAAEPFAVPAVPGFESSHNSGLGDLDELDAVVAAPLADGAVAAIGNGGTGFLVGEEVAKACLAVEKLELFDGGTGADQQGALELMNPALELVEALGLELPLVWTELRLGKNGGFDQEEEDDGVTSLERRVKWGVVGQAKVALEPDNGGGMEQVLELPGHVGMVGLGAAL